MSTGLEAPPSSGVDDVENEKDGAGGVGSGENLEVEAKSEKAEGQEYNKEAWEKLKEEYGIAEGSVITGLDKDGKKVMPRVLKIDEENGRIIYDTAEGKVKDFPIQELLKAQERGRLVKPIATTEVLSMFNEDIDLDEIIGEVYKTNPRLADDMEALKKKYNEGQVPGQKYSTPDAYVAGQLEEMFGAQEKEVERKSEDASEGTDTLGDKQTGVEYIEAQKKAGLMQGSDDPVRRAAERGRRAVDRENDLQEEAKQGVKEAETLGKQQFRDQGPRVQNRVAAERARKQDQAQRLEGARKQAGQPLGPEAERLARRAAAAREQKNTPGATESSEEQEKRK